MGSLLAILLALATPLEGQRIAAVALEAEDQVRLARYLEIAPGDAFASAALQKAVERLYATGEFEDVLVEAEPRADGVALVFRPVPAPLLAGVRVAGERVISAEAVRRAAQLRQGEPLWPARLDAAAQAAALALVGKGYLEGRVTAGAERRGARANALFRVMAGPRARVQGVAIEGASRGQQSLLRGLAAPRPGQVFERERARAAAERMRRRLVASGLWRATVEARELYDPIRAGVQLVFAVSPGSLARVEFRGDRPAAGLRRRIEALLREGALQEDALDEGAERIEDALHEKGHRQAKVERTLEESAAGSVLVYDVAAGPISLAHSVRVAGGEPALALLLETREGLPIQDKLIDADVRALTRALESDGFADAKVEAELPEGGGELPVVFRVRPGARTLVGAFSVEAPPLDGAEPARPLRTRAGDAYRVRDLGSDRQTLLAAWRNAGYLQAVVQPELSFSEDRSLASVVLRVTPGERTDVDRIIVKGLERTRDRVVRRELALKEGEPLGLKSLRESERRLGALGIFQQVGITELEEGTAPRKSIVVSASEAPTTTFAYGLGYAEQDRVRGSLEVTRHNLFGLDRTLSAFARASFRANRVLLSYREPYLFGRKLELFVTGFREQEQREGFSFVRGGTLLQTAFSLSGKRSLIVRYAYNKTHTYDVSVPLSEVDRQFQDATFSGPSATLLQDTRDDPLDPRRGRFLSGSLQLSLKALGGDSFLKSYFEASAYQPLNARTLVALSSRVGLARSFGFPTPTGLPLPERFFAGGDYSLRGFKLDAVEPSGGNALLLESVELRFDLSRSVSLAAFSDVGNVYPFVSDLDLGDLRYSAGLGVRYRTAFGPLRVDWAYKLDRRADEAAYRFHVTVGHAF
jgi:outer membrane protein insertion porin family